MKCEIEECDVDTEDVQSFTLKDPQQTLLLCKKHYEMVQKNNRVTGKLVVTKCKACHQFTGYEWVKYKPSGRPKSGSKGNEKLDNFFDMRSPVEMLFDKPKRTKKVKSAIVGDAPPVVLVEESEIKVEDKPEVTGG